MFKGAITALITPFKDGKLDEEGYQSFIEWQISQGIHGVVPCGTTGESPTLSHVEHNRVIELCIEAVAGRVPVIAGSGSNSTEEAIMMASHAKIVGADAILVVTPYYNKPSQEGMYQHFKAIHDAVEIPIIIYNIPGRSVVDLQDDTIARLAKLPNVVGIKDATGDLSRVSKLRMKVSSDFCQLSGEDGTALAFNAQGGVGCISVTANIAPKLCASLHDTWFKGDVKKALAIHDKLMPLHLAMFCETSPGPVKYAASLLGYCRPELRLPLVEPTDASKAYIRTVMESLGILETALSHTA